VASFQFFQTRCKTVLGVAVGTSLLSHTMYEIVCLTEDGPAQRSLTLRPARSRSRHATLYIESFDSFVASATASIATGWSEPVPGRELHPLKSSAFSRRTITSTIVQGVVPKKLPCAMR
jgi:hypothetical protein